MFLFLFIHYQEIPLTANLKLQDDIYRTPRVKRSARLREPAAAVAPPPAPVIDEAEEEKEKGPDTPSATDKVKAEKKPVKGGRRGGKSSSAPGSKAPKTSTAKAATAAATAAASASVAPTKTASRKTSKNESDPVEVN